VHVRAIRETCSRSYSPEQIAAWARLLSPDSYRAVLGKRVIVVATDGAMVVGFGQLNPDTGEVDAVYVLPGRQGEGIGRMLLSDLEEHARARGIATLELSATLNAAEFYERAGYRQRQAAVHRLPTGEELQCIRMSKRL
jgi:GNAT superfamily N-acetyltransferase